MMAVSVMLPGAKIYTRLHGPCARVSNQWFFAKFYQKVYQSPNLHTYLLVLFNKYTVYTDDMGLNFYTSFIVIHSKVQTLGSSIIELRQNLVYSTKILRIFGKQTLSST